MTVLTIATVGLPAAGHARPQGYNGEWVAFETDRDGNAEVYVVASDGSGTVRNVTRHAAADRQPSWAAGPVTDGLCTDQDVRLPPSSHVLAFQSDRGGTSDIYVVDAYAALQGPVEPRRVTPDLANETAPAMAPTPPGGQYVDLIAYATDAPGPREIFVRSEDGSVFVNVSTAAGADDTNPDWSRDGRYLAFESDRGGSRQIWAVRVFGPDGTLSVGQPYAVTQGGGPKYEPSWVDYQDPTPPGIEYDGQIVYSVEQHGRRYLDVVEYEVPSSAIPPDPAFDLVPFGDLGRIDSFPLTGDPGGDSAPNWSPIRLDVVYATTRGGGRRDLHTLHGGEGTPLGSITGVLVGHPADDTNPDWQTVSKCAEMRPRPPRPAPAGIARTPGGGGGGGSGGGGPGGGPSGGGGPPGGGGGPIPPSRCTVRGTRGKNILRGTRRADIICGFGGNDRILARGGRDTVDGGPGHDRIYGGSGNDRIVAGRGRDSAFGESGNDSLSMKDRERDRVSGGRGRDTARVDRGDRVRGVERRLR